MLRAESSGTTLCGGGGVVDEQRQRGELTGRPKVITFEEYRRETSGHNTRQLVTTPPSIIDDAVITIKSLAITVDTHRETSLRICIFENRS